MTASDRRTALRFLGALSAAPALAMPGAAFASGRRVVFPHGEFVLQRQLERGLAGGTSLTVTREWRARFGPDESGAWATGEQISCEVNAPAVLKPIADIERGRTAPGPFPAQLNISGRIIGSTAESAQGKAAAVRAALKILDNADRAPSEINFAKASLRDLATAAGAVISDTPPDLFFPVAGEAFDRRELALPGNLLGEVEVNLVARAAPGGLLESFERVITTRIGPDTRVSGEIWSLKRA